MKFLKQGSELFERAYEIIVGLMNNLDDFEGIVVQTNNDLNIILSNKTFKSLTSSEQSDLMRVCAEVIANNLPQRIQRHFNNHFFALMAVPLINGVAMTGFKISFKIFKDIVLDNMSDAVFYISVEDGQFFFRGVNSMFLDVFGVKERELIDKNILDVVPNPYRDEGLALCRQVIKEKKALRREVTTSFSKDIKYGEVVLSPVCNGNECLALIGIFHDVTERTVAEMELAKNYSLLNEIVESTSDIIFIKDVSGRYVLANSSAGKLINRSSLELIGKIDLEIFSEATASQFMTNDRLSRDSAVMQYFEEEVDINNKHYFFHSAKGPYRDKKGDIAGSIGISRDITDMKMAERKLAHSVSMLVATLNATADGILVLDTNKKITHYNSRFLNLWQIPEDMLLNNAYDEILKKVLDQLRNPEECLERLKQLEQVPNLESYDLLFFKDGRMLERYTIPQVLNGQVVGRVFSYRDLSHREDAKLKVPNLEK
jgi:PAS domain S-box-containing protein